ncbi:hypothetical protein H4R21_003070 [Coemansia helicoidea]|uniref:Uncharacterized protein n=1 Tax=Coemansia helicoidea TaxID=1286919 RepID=A0ACC1L4D6_9FUNG|nr:hypothetical protein H4R21_003070 [Coemansia helicoidea]
MAKKFTGENTKVKAAKEKKAEAKAEKDAKVQKKKDADEAQQWQAGAKQGGKKEDLEAKRLEKLARKKEADALLAAENKDNAKAKAPRGPAHSVKPAAVRGAEKKAAARAEKVAAAADEQPAQVETFAASNIDDALSLLDAIDMAADVPADGAAGATSRPVKADLVDRHPERRAKAAFAAYTERMLPVIKEEHPGLRQSQMKEIIFKRWQKAPENPFNQVHVAYDAKQDDVRGIIEQEKQQTKDRLRVD